MPDLNDVNEKLFKQTGWQVVSVPGSLQEEPLFQLMANRQWPVGCTIRPSDQLEYTDDADIFHDLFGHVPLFLDPVYADFLAQYGELGLKVIPQGLSKKLARLWWYTIEFGLIREAGQLHIYGGGIMSSANHVLYCLEDPAPKRLPFDLRRILQTQYKENIFINETYFVIDSFKQLADAVFGEDFSKVHQSLENTREYSPASTLI